MESDKNITVIQYRTDESEIHEQECFRDDFSDLGVEFEFINAIKERLSSKIVEDTQGLILGGSTEFSLSEMDHQKHTWIDDSFEILDELTDRVIPTLGICFGYHLITLHQGGKITNEEKYHQNGSFELSLSEHKHKCNIFSQLPDRFHAQLGHVDTPIELPENSLSLASSNEVPHQAFKSEDKPMWGVLFHPELDKRKARERLAMFLDCEIGSDEFKKEVKKLEDSPESKQVIHEFIKLVKKKT